MAPCTGSPNAVNLAVVPQGPCRACRYQGPGESLHPVSKGQAPPARAAFPAVIAVRSYPGGTAGCSYNSPKTLALSRRQAWAAIGSIHRRRGLALLAGPSAIRRGSRAGHISGIARFVFTTMARLVILPFRIPVMIAVFLRSLASPLTLHHSVSPSPAQRSDVPPRQMFPQLR